VELHQTSEATVMTKFKIRSDIAKFDPHTTKYTAANALVLADAALLAYEDEAVAESVAKNDWKLTNFAFFGERGRSTQAIVMGNHEFIITAFRGTEINKLQDFIADMKIAHKSKGPAGKVHRGFLAALQEVWPDIKQTINTFQDNGQSLWFTGHSLGAALAALAVADLRLVDHRPVNGLYTFGQPRTGDSEFASAFDADFKSQTFRFMNNNDIVTRLLIVSYRHIGRLLYFDATGALRDDIGTLDRILDWGKGLAGDFGKPGLDDIKDHGMDGYAELLSRNMTVRLA
jgi:hypothetical protein